MASSSTETSRPVLSNEAVEVLERQYLLSPSQDGKRTISTSILSKSPPPKTREIHSLPSPSATIETSDFQASREHTLTDSFWIPELLESIETLEYLGFTGARAREVWTTYRAQLQDEDLAWGFFDHALDQAEPHDVEDAHCASDDWADCMTKIGIDAHVQKAILLPEFSDLRYTASCKFWIKDTMKLRWSSLITLDEQVTSAKKAQGPTSDTPPSCRESIKGRPNETSTGSSSKDAPSPTISTINAPRSLAHHTMLWRATEKSKAAELYNVETKTLTLDSDSTAPGDFSGKIPKTYFTPQKETADHNARWMRYRSPASNITIVQIAVPESFLSTLDKLLLYSDEGLPLDAWKHIVWSCQRGERRWPKGQLRQWGYSKDLIVGHIASGKQRKYTEIRSWDQIRDSDVLKVDIDGRERLAVQWVFNTDEAIDGVEDVVGGKVWLHDLGSMLQPIR